MDYHVHKRKRRGGEEHKGAHTDTRAPGRLFSSVFAFCLSAGAKVWDILADQRIRESFLFLFVSSLTARLLLREGHEAVHNRGRAQTSCVSSGAI